MKTQDKCFPCIFIHLSAYLSVYFPSFFQLQALTELFVSCAFDTHAPATDGMHAQNSCKLEANHVCNTHYYLVMVR